MFVSADPIHLEGGTNLYNFAPNAVLWTDPLGLSCGRAVKQNSRGQWIDERGRFAKAPGQTPSDFARSLQGSGSYPGVDRYRDISLKKGTIIYGGQCG